MNEMKLYGAIAAVFAFLSIQAVGGGPAVLPEMERSVISSFHLSSDQFVQAYGLGQLVPGPNMLLIVVLGYRIAGAVGALIALFAFFIPMSIVVVLVGRYIVHLPASPWKRAVQDGLAPVTIGLMASGAYAMGRSATTTIPTMLIGAVVVVLMLGTKINPIWLVVASAITGALVLRH